VILWPKVLVEGHNLSVREFLKIYKLTKNPNSECIFNFQGRRKVKFILLTEYSSNIGWKNKFFFAQGDWEFTSMEVFVDPSVHRKTCCPSVSGQEEPILDESEDTYVKELWQYAREHASEMEFNAIFSQAALAACLRYPPTEGPVEGGVPAEMGVLVEIEA
jgi:hypothetical protein